MAAQSNAIETAWQLACTGRAAMAVRLCQGVLHDSPDDAEAHHLIGLLALAAGNIGEALGALTRTVAIAADEARFHSSLGAALRVAGALAEARDHLAKAIELDPAFTEPRINLAGILFAQGEQEAARAQYEAVLDHDPTCIEALNNLGVILVAADQAEAAIAHYRDGLAIAKDEPRLLSGLAGIHASQGDYRAAANAYFTVWHMAPQDKGARDGLVMCLGALGRTDPGAAIAEALPGLLRRPEVDAQALTGTAIALLADRPAYAEAVRLAGQPGLFAQAFAAGTLDALMADDLFLAALANAIAPDPDFERVVARLRACALESHANPPLPFLSALALHAIATEHVAATTVAEVTEAERLWHAVDDALVSATPDDVAIQTKLLIAAAYKPLHRMKAWRLAPDLADADWPEPVRVVLDRAVAAPLREQAIAEAIESFGPVADSVSRKVKDQYEENPYPRWRVLPPGGASSAADYFRTCLPSVRPPAFAARPMDILIAGCGTGREALSIARVFADSRVTAIDLSRASLAYAVAQAERLGIGNLTFRQGDLLAVGALGQRFDLIFSSGVLHHMDRPEDGLAALVDMLAPGGMIMIALYSRIARRAVTAARRRIAADARTVTSEAIRTFRADVMAEGPSGALWPLTASTDFYTMSGARDLAFHVQEHQFDPPEAGALVSGTGLELLGLQFADPRVPRAYRDAFPDDPSMTNLDNWYAFEQHRPTTFAGMIHLWCRKPETG